MTDFKIKMAELAAKYNISHKRDIDWHNFVAEVEQLTEEQPEKDCAELIESSRALYFDLGFCITELLRARREGNEQHECNALSRMEGLMNESQQQLSCIIDYLEKQKEASKAIEAVERIDKYIDEHLANAHDMKDSNPDKKYYRGWDDALGKMSGILQDVYSGEKQKEQKPAEPGYSNDNSEYDKGYMDGKAFQLKQTEQYSIGKTFMGLIPCWVNAPSELQPAHKYHGKNAVIMHENNGGFRCCFIDDDKPVTIHLPENTLFVEGWRKKPTEWSEVELEFRGEKVKVKRPFFRDDKGRGYSTTEQDEDVAWYALRAWCEKKGVSLYDLYPRTEWSEEDEKKINFLSRLIEFQVKDDEYCFGDGRLISKQEAIEMLKSLRSRPKSSDNWKPSEEQMKALLNAKWYLRKGDQFDSAKSIAQLYEQLKKL